MFSYRCYVCSFKLGDGIPPIEALSKDQNQYVGHEDAPQRYDTLDGTPFEGMSTYSFCGFCLVAITEFPQVFTGKTRDRFLGFVQSGRPSSQDAFVSGDDEVYAAHYAFDWTHASRMQTRLAAAYIYRNGEFSLLDLLLTLTWENS